MWYDGVDKVLTTTTMEPLVARLIGAELALGNLTISASSPSFGKGLVADRGFKEDGQLGDVACLWFTNLQQLRLFFLRRHQDKLIAPSK